MNVQSSQRQTYQLTMLFYLVVGACGLIFFIGTILNEIGWLEPAVRTVFGDKSDSVLETLSGLSILFTYLLGFFLFSGWLPAILIVFRFRRSWQIWAPSALFLVMEILLISFVNSDDFEQSRLEYVFGSLIALYFVVSLLAGVWMTKERARPL